MAPPSGRPGRKRNKRNVPRSNGTIDMTFNATASNLVAASAALAVKAPPLTEENVSRVPETSSGESSKVASAIEELTTKVPTNGGTSKEFWADIMADNEEKVHKKKKKDESGESPIQNRDIEIEMPSSARVIETSKVGHAPLEIAVPLTLESPINAEDIEEEQTAAALAEREEEHIPAIRGEGESDMVPPAFEMSSHSAPAISTPSWSQVAAMEVANVQESMEHIAEEEGTRVEVSVVEDISTSINVGPPGGVDSSASAKGSLSEGVPATEKELKMISQLSLESGVIAIGSGFLLRDWKASFQSKSQRFEDFQFYYRSQEVGSSNGLLGEVWEGWPYNAEEVAPGGNDEPVMAPQMPQNPRDIPDRLLEDGIIDNTNAASTATSNHDRKPQSKKNAKRRVKRKEEREKRRMVAAGTTQTSDPKTIEPEANGWKGFMWILAIFVVVFILMINLAQMNTF